MTTTVFPKGADGWEPNEEGKLPKEAVPYEQLGYAELPKPEDLKIILVHRWFSPPSAVLRTVLNYYGLQQERIVMDLPFKKSIEKSAYKKVPFIIVMPSDADSESGGCQVNDTKSVMKTLYPILTGGRKLSDDLLQEEEKKIFPKMLCSMLVDLVITHDQSACMSRHFMSGESTKANPLLKLLGVQIIKKNNHGFKEKGVFPFSEILQWFVETIQKKKEGAVFLGGDEPNPLDVFVYGIVVYAMVVTEDRVNKGILPEGEGCPWVYKDLETAGAMDWFQAMDKAYKERAKEPVFPEEVINDAARTLWGFS